MLHSLWLEKIMTSSVLSNHVFMVCFPKYCILDLKRVKDCTFHLTSDKKLVSHFEFKLMGNTFYYKIFSLWSPGLRQFWLTLAAWGLYVSIIENRCSGLWPILPSVSPSWKQLFSLPWGFRKPLFQVKVKNKTKLMLHFFPFFTATF